jgi:hypothetical protein
MSRHRGRREQQRSLDPDKAAMSAADRKQRPHRADLRIRGFADTTIYTYTIFAIAFARCPATPSGSAWNC